MRRSGRVLSIDPGRDKCGLAVVDQAEGVLQQAVISADKLIPSVERWCRDYVCPVVLVGDKTACKTVIERLAPLLAEKKIEAIITVDEHKTTEEARLRYWQAHSPDGLKRFLPLGLLSPPCAIDDFAAIILAERYFAQCMKNF